MAAAISFVRDEGLTQHALNPLLWPGCSTKTAALAVTDAGALDVVCVILVPLPLDKGRNIVITAKEESQGQINNLNSKENTTLCWHNNKTKISEKSAQF